jgi:hypothetical protein
MLAVHFTKTVCEVGDKLICFPMVTLLLSIHIPQHHVVTLKYTGQNLF